MYKKINLDTWKRKTTYEFFKGFDDPFFNMTANVDVSKLFLHCKKAGESFFLSSLHASTRACNAIDNFRMRIQDDQPVIYDKIHCGSTVLHEDNTFTYCYFEYMEERAAFLKKGKFDLEAHFNNPFFDPRHNDKDLLYYSVIPWVHFSQFKHARQKREGDSIPRIMFGKVKEIAPGKFEMPIAIEVNHALCDGYHVGLYYEKVQNFLNDFE